MTKRTTQFYLLTLLFLLCTATTALAQRRVEGRVVDNETGETLPGVNLVTRNGTYAVTDEKGTYNLSITRGDSVTVSYVGYEPQTLPAQLQPIIGSKEGIMYATLAFCNPGDKIHTVTKIKKIVSASTEEALDVVDSVYLSILQNGTFRASSIKVAEATTVS